MDSIAHRGPDDRGDFQSGNVSLGFVRLSIIDLSPAGHQPMVDATGDLTIVFNGEIYNYRELRAELTSAGHRFVSDSDTEVLLTAWRVWGEGCLARLNGMFSFVVHDRRTGALFGARDRLGEKPLYLWRNADWTILASEPRAIAATGLVAARPDWKRVAEFVVDGELDHDGGTCIEGVSQVPAGHAVVVAPDGATRLRPWWSVPLAAATEPSRTEAAWTDELCALVTDAVRLRLRSDVPVGFTLSGGIDSTLLICEAGRHSRVRFDAFSFHDAQFDERPLIDETLALTGARGHTVDADAIDFAALLPAVIAANGEPVHSLAAVANYALFGLARQHGVKVVLGGQAADEVFLGYRSFEWDRWHALARSGAWSNLVADMRASARRHDRSLVPIARDVAMRALRSALAPSTPYRWLRAARGRLAPPAARYPVFANDFVGRNRHRPEPFVDSPCLADHQRRALVVSPLPLYLRVEDRVSMAHSVEARLPFADHRLVEHAMRLPDHLKFAEGLNKVALRRVAASRVPEPVTRSARKLGFPVGESVRTAQGLRKLCRELAATRSFRERGIYALDHVDRLLAREARADDVDALFHLAQMELWLSGLDRGGVSA